MKITRRQLRNLIVENLAQEKDLLNEVKLRKYQKALAVARAAEATPDDEEWEEVEKAVSELKGMRDNKDADGNPKPRGPFRFREKSPRRSRAEDLLASLERFLANQPVSDADAESNPTDNVEIPLDGKVEDQDGEGSSETNPDTPGTGRRYVPTENFPIEQGHRDPNPKSKQGNIAKLQGHIGAKSDGYFGSNTKKAVLAYTEKLSGVDQTAVITKAIYDAIMAEEPAERQVRSTPASSEETASTPDESAESETSPTPGSNIPAPVTFEGDDMAFQRKVNERFSGLKIDSVPGGMKFNAGNQGKRRIAHQKVIDWLYSKDVYWAAGGDFEDIEKSDRITATRALSVHENWKAQAFEEYKKVINLDGASMGGDTVAPLVKTILEYAYEAFARINESHYWEKRREESRNLSESFSHGYLIRQRYRRY